MQPACLYICSSIFQVSLFSENTLLSLFMVFIHSIYFLKLFFRAPGLVSVCGCFVYCFWDFFKYQICNLICYRLSSSSMSVLSISFLPMQGRREKVPHIAKHNSRICVIYCICVTLVKK